MSRPAADSSRSARASNSSTARCRSVRSCRRSATCTGGSTPQRRPRWSATRNPPSPASSRSSREALRTDDVDDGAALFEHLLATLQRLGDHVPTLLVLEDLHWADHSTRDFLVFLARNLRDARVLVVGTFRTDDLHRRHPLRPVLAELDRSGAAHRLDLVRFDRDEIGELIAAIRGEAAAADLVDSTFERSDGNAFFAEELLAAEEMCEDTLPDSLRDIVLAARRCAHGRRGAGPARRRRDRPDCRLPLGERGRADPRGRAHRGFARCRHASGAHRGARRPRVPVPARARLRDGVRRLAAERTGPAARPHRRAARGAARLVRR